MAGMLTGDCAVRLEVAGMCQQSLFHTSNYTITVPYSSMSKTMQNISRMGGKVVGVQVSDSQSVAARTEPTAADSTDAESKAASAPKQGRKK